MIRFRLKELMADKGFRERRVVTVTEVAQDTGINRMTLSKIANHAGYSTVTDTLDKLCNYFECELGQLAEHIPDTTNLNGDVTAPKSKTD
jgi:putative transcriptional regulator